MKSALDAYYTSAYHDEESIASKDLELVGSGTSPVRTAAATMTRSRSAGAFTGAAHALADVGADKTIWAFAGWSAESPRWPCKCEVASYLDRGLTTVMGVWRAVFLCDSMESANLTSKLHGASWLIKGKWSLAS